MKDYAPAGVTVIVGRLPTDYTCGSQRTIILHRTAPSKTVGGAGDITAADMTARGFVAGSRNTTIRERSSAGNFTSSSFRGRLV